MMSVTARPQIPSIPTICNGCAEILESRASSTTICEAYTAVDATTSMHPKSYSFHGRAVVSSYEARIQLKPTRNKAITVSNTETH